MGSPAASFGMVNRIPAVAIGIDVGTTGVRVAAADASGELLEEVRHLLPPSCNPCGSVREQEPEDWWAGVRQATRSVMGRLKKPDIPVNVAAVSVTSTSGSLVVTTAGGRPVRPAIMYDDPRGAAIADALNRQTPPGSLSLDSSYSLVKAAWIRQEEPRVWQRVRHLLHPADWLAGKLTGDFGFSDHANALKLGYDPERAKWSKAVSLASIPTALLPKVVAPGRQIGTVSALASEETGLPRNTAVLAGATDGVASLIASGAREPKQANTTLGTTLVWKVLAKTKPMMLSQGLYSHSHPCGLWALGAASNTGPGSLLRQDPSTTPSQMDRLAAASLPTRTVCYVLRGRGERFPFADEQAVGFFEGHPCNPSEWYAAQLQSIAFVERWGYERLRRCAIETGEVVFTTGGAAESDVLAQLRADVLNCVILRALHPTAAFGAAILAAGGTVYAGNLPAAIAAMTTVGAAFSPASELGQRYDEIYARFREACARRGYT